MHHQAEPEKRGTEGRHTKRQTVSRRMKAERERERQREGHAGRSMRLNRAACLSLQCRFIVKQ